MKRIPTNKSNNVRGIRERAKQPGNQVGRFARVCRVSDGKTVPLLNKKRRNWSRVDLFHAFPPVERIGEPVTRQKENSMVGVFPAFYLWMSIARPKGKRLQADESKETNRRKEFVRGEGWRSSRGNVASPRLVACFLVRESIFCVFSFSSGLLCDVASGEDDFINGALKFVGVRTVMLL